MESPRAVRYIVHREVTVPRADRNSRRAADPETGDVISHLEKAEEAILAQEASWQNRVQELEEALRGTRETNRDLGRHLEDLAGQLDEARKRAERDRERAARLTELIQQLHRGLFGGNIYEMILRACITISGATRGLYVTWRGAPDAPRVRAAFEIEGYPGSPPSAFVTALCGRVLELQDTIVCNDLDTSDFPRPEREEERFRNCAVIPALLMKDFDGVVLVANKEHGEFNEEDLESMLSIGDHASVALENVQLQRELQQAYVATISALADAVEAKDPYTHGHCEMTSRYARLTAERLELPEHERAIICYAALLHDVGKIGVSDGVLNKPGALLPEERELVRAHVRVGHDLIRNVPALDNVAMAVLHHHEWYDGSGYPDGLEGEKIPIASRVVAVVDAFGAMITRRSYKEAYSEEYAREELRRFAGKQFDPGVVKAFLAVLDEVGKNGMRDEDDGQCGVLPGFPHVRNLQSAFPQSGR